MQRRLGKTIWFISVILFSLSILQLPNVKANEEQENYIHNQVLSQSVPFDESKPITDCETHLQNKYKNSTHWQIRTTHWTDNITQTIPVYLYV